MNCKKVIHEAYKKVVKKMLHDFFIESTRHFGGLKDEKVTVKEMNDFIDDWMRVNISESITEWSPDQ